jgi:hypothetical protein
VGAFGGKIAQLLSVFTNIKLRRRTHRELLPPLFRHDYFIPIMGIHMVSEFMECIYSIEYGQR